MHASWGEGQKKRERDTERENVKHSPCSAVSPTQDSIPQPQDHELSQN